MSQTGMPPDLLHTPHLTIARPLTFQVFGKFAHAHFITPGAPLLAFTLFSACFRFSGLRIASMRLSPTTGFLAPAVSEGFQP